MKTTTQCEKEAQEIREGLDGFTCTKGNGCVYWGEEDCSFWLSKRGFDGCTKFRDMLPTPQEKVRETLARILYHHNQSVVFEAPPHKSIQEVVEELIRSLDSQGVVLKVVPNEKWCPQHGYPTPCDKCGTVTERLIKKED